MSPAIELGIYVAVAVAAGVIAGKYVTVGSIMFAVLYVCMTVREYRRQPEPRSIITAMSNAGGPFMVCVFVGGFCYLLLREAIWHIPIPPADPGDYPAKENY